MSETSEKRPSFDHLVVIGSSAGGITALSTLVATLPRDFPAPIVIAQHLDPARPSHLAEILGRRATLPVRRLSGQEALEPGVIFVVPSNQNVEITDHAVRLSTESDGRSKPSIDLLLSSAATVYGEHLIAVILTGSGSDGTAGARSVKAAGGTVVIQDPKMAEFPSMPRALAPTSVDVVANLDTMGAVLHTLASGMKPSAPPTDEDALLAVLAEVKMRRKLDFTHYKLPTILRRLHRRMAATGMTSLSAYHSYLVTHPTECLCLVNSFLIKVTEFFRDPALFDQLQHQVLPDLIARAREQDHELRFWSAGCATGEEAFSLAILVAEILGNELEQFTIRIFATDLDRDAVTFARRGLYPAAALAPLGADLTARYFTGVDGDYEVTRRLRGLVVFGEHDLGERPPFPRIDLALCRNVLIYFTEELQTRALQLFAFAVRDGGYLVLGTAETPRPLDDYFEPDGPSLKIYRRHGARTVLPPTWSKAAPTAAPSHPPAWSPSPANQHPTGAPEHRSERTRAGWIGPEDLLDVIPMGVVVVDRRYDILAINRAARRFLGIYHEAIGEDLIHLAQGIPALLLRDAIRRWCAAARRCAWSRPCRSSWPPERNAPWRLTAGWRSRTTPRGKPSP